MLYYLCRLKRSVITAIFASCSCVLTVNFTAYALVDREIQESKKCSNVFSYFEEKYNLPKDILHSISLQETQKSHSEHNKLKMVWPWTINVEGQGYHFKDKREAIQFTMNQIRLGKRSIDIGCMQINLKHHPEAFASIDHAFSPRKNVAYAASLLRQYYDKHQSWDKAIGNYHSGTEHLAKKYQSRVSKISSQMHVYKNDLQNFIYDQYAKTKSMALNQRQNRRSTTMDMMDGGRHVAGHSSATAGVTTAQEVAMHSSYPSSYKDYDSNGQRGAVIYRNNDRKKTKSLKYLQARTAKQERTAKALEYNELFCQRR